MIPKKIHYCWFGKKPKPERVLKYIDTWKKYLPDYEIKEWNEDNFDVNRLKFTKEAYALKKYAFVSDVARIYALYTEGGIYLDTDIEIVKSFNPLLNNKSFVGWEDNRLGTGVMASIKGTKWLKDFLDIYKEKEFIKYSGKLNEVPNPYLLCNILKSFGLILNHKNDILDDDIAVYQIDYLCAHNLEKQTYIITENTFSIHHYEGSWCKNLTILQKIYYRIRCIITKLRLSIINNNQIVKCHQ